jgi:archaellum component FlaC
VSDLSAGDGDGQEYSMLEQRVVHVEDDVNEIKISFRSIATKLNSIAESVAEIKGKISQSPSWIQLLVALIATWGAGAAIVAALIRFAPR